MPSPVFKKAFISTTLLASMFLASPAFVSVKAADTTETWSAKVRSEIASQQFYPKSAVSKKLEGKVELLLDISAEGYLTGVKIVETSGHDLLDQTAMKQILAMNKLPALPEGITSGTVLVPVSFTL